MLPPTRLRAVTIPLSGYVERYLIALWTLITWCVGTGPVVGCPPSLLMDCQHTHSLIWRPQEW